MADGFEIDEQSLTREIRSLGKRFKQMDRKLARKAVSGVMRAEAKNLQSRIQEAAPTGESGQLRGRFKVRALGRSRTFFGVQIVHGEELPYESFVELGTRDREGQGYIRQTVKRERGAILGRLAAGLKDALEDVARNG